MGYKEEERTKTWENNVMMRKGSATLQKDSTHRTCNDLLYFSNAEFFTQHFGDHCISYIWGPAVCVASLDVLTAFDLMDYNELVKALVFRV